MLKLLFWGIFFGLYGYNPYFAYKQTRRSRENTGLWPSWARPPTHKDAAVRERDGCAKKAERNRPEPGSPLAAQARSANTQQKKRYRQKGREDVEMG